MVARGRCRRAEGGQKRLAITSGNKITSDWVVPDKRVWYMTNDPWFAAEFN